MARRRKNRADFSFDFSALTFSHSKSEEEQTEIPKLSTEPVAFENAEAMAEAMEYGNDYFALVSGKFIFGDFIEALCFKKRLAPSEIYITTLGMSKDNVDSIVNLVDYLRCRKVNLIISHYFEGVERYGIMPYIRQEFSGRPIDVAVLQSHCKIALIFSHKGNIMISGSANLSSSNNVENFIIMHDETTIAFTKERLDNIMKRFTVYNGMESKSIPQNNKQNTGKYAYESLTEGGKYDGSERERELEKIQQIR